MVWSATEGSYTKKTNGIRKYLSHLRSVWADMVLSSDLKKEAVFFLSHPLRNSHPLIEALTALISQKLGLIPLPLKESFSALTIGEMAELSLLRSIAGADGQRLGNQILPFCSFPSLWCSEDAYCLHKADHAIQMLLSAFGKNLNFGFSCHEIQRDFEQIFASGVEDKGGTSPLLRRRSEKMPKTPEYQANKPEVQVKKSLEGSFEGQDPYFLALSKVLPKMEEYADSEPAFAHCLKLGYSVQNAFVKFGEGIPLGAIRAGEIEIPALGPQVHPLNDLYSFGIFRKISDPRWSSLVSQSEVWFEYFSPPNFEGLEVRFLGLDLDTKVSFVFYVRAQVAKIEGKKYLPKSLQRYCGGAKKVVFEKEGSCLSIENLLPHKMELIPLAGQGSFWDSDFLLGFEIPSHDGRALFQFIC